MRKTLKKRNRKNTEPTPRQVRVPHARLLLFLLFATSLVLGGTYVATDDGAFPVRKVRVDGRFRHLIPEQIEVLVANNVAGGFFALDIDALRQQVISEPWVRDAAVQRSWPDTVRISVYEQEPVVRWGADSLLNNEAQVFTPTNTGEAGVLAQLKGPDGKQLEMLEHYHEFRSMLAPLNLDIKQLQLSARRTWIVDLDNNFRLMLGQSDEMNRMRRFVEVYAEVFKDRVTQVKRIDLRYTNGFAVLWEQDSGDKG